MSTSILVEDVEVDLCAPARRLAKLPSSPMITPIAVLTTIWIASAHTSHFMYSALSNPANPGAVLTSSIIVPGVEKWVHESS